MNDQRVKGNYDSHAKALKTLCPGDSVRIKPTNPTDKQRGKGTTVKRLDHQSYELQPDNGILTRRNHVHLRPAGSPGTPQITKDVTSLVHHNDPASKVDQYTPTHSGRILKPVQRVGFEKRAVSRLYSTTVVNCLHCCHTDTLNAITLPCLNYTHSTSLSI